MCFYNQKKFVCGDHSWTKFVQQCNFEYRTGETCGFKLVNATEYEATICRICEKINAKERKKKQEVERVSRWKRDGGHLKASIAKSEMLILDYDRQIEELHEQRQKKENTF
ncbi:hypothetical protein BJY04DRAFT_136778 [Aspergillus karnatakaensis]|uniref:uncharacterized protein n=1 Tax=Aspergillus karnatakaensis TaxID=1810916 RepID=UPI003CCCD759